MAMPTPDSIRNLCFCGQTGSGKTTLVERLLFESGEISRQGNVEDGNTVSDYSDEERRYRHSLQPSIVHFDHEVLHVNVIDTPGMSDFIGHAIACFPAVESVVVVIDAAKGIESETSRLMQVAADRKLPRMFLINKIDLPDVDLGALVHDLRETFGEICLPINMPTPDRSDVIDIFETDAHDATAFSSAKVAHTRIVEQVVEVDDQLTENYLEEGAERLDPKRLHEAFEKALCEGHLVPIVFASAITGSGIGHLLHVTASLLPSPLEGNPRPFVRGDDPLPTQFDPDKPTIAHVFRVATDPHIGKLGIFRVHQGCVRSRTERYMGDITGDLSGKRGRIQDTPMVNDMCLIRAIAPLRELQLRNRFEEHHSGIRRLHAGTIRTTNRRHRWFNRKSSPRTNRTITAIESDGFLRTFGKTSGRRDLSGNRKFQRLGETLRLSSTESLATCAERQRDIKTR